MVRMDSDMQENGSTQTAISFMDVSPSVSTLEIRDMGRGTTEQSHGEEAPSQEDKGHDLISRKIQSRFERCGPESVDLDLGALGND
jgi:hypothetical protein